MRLRRLRPACVSVSVLALAALVSAQAPQPGRETSAASVASYTLAQQMPRDPEAIVGALPNGLRYYVRPNGKPARRVELRLVVNAGSVLEDDDQQGLAHFVEHMEFEGTRNFPGRSITDFLSSLGLSIGADANAADQLRRHAVHPADAVRRAGRARHGAGRAPGLGPGARPSISRPSTRQRGIVLSEWRMHLGAGERTARQASGRRSSRSRATRIGRRSASPRASRTRAASSWCASTATGTGPT